MKQKRVLIVTESAGRVRNTLSAIDHITGGRGSNFFLLIDQATWVLAIPLEAEWTSGKRHVVRLTD